MTKAFSFFFIFLFLLVSQRTIGQGVIGNNLSETKGDKPLSISSNTVNCDSLRYDVENYVAERVWQKAYDTSKKFIDNCYNDPNAPRMFQQFRAALQPLAESDSSLWLDGRQWLESVLYLNTTNPEYFCACVEAIAGTFNSPSDTTEPLWWKDLNRGLAIDQWLVDHTSCDTPNIQNGIYGARASQYSDWLNDTTVPLDTTLPPLSSLGGLDTILAKHFLYINDVRQSQPRIISNATANPNPTGEGTVISFGISKEAYVKIELFNVLGHEVSPTNFESLFEPGKKSVPLSLQGLPSGTYFARILTAYGEAQSVKLVKE